MPFAPGQYAGPRTAVPAVFGAPPRPPPPPPPRAAGAAASPATGMSPSSVGIRAAPLPPAGDAASAANDPGGTNFQTCWPVTASTAYTPFGALKYMTPSTTIGALAKRPEPVRKVHARFNCCTFDVLICVSGEKRVPPASACGDAQLPPASGAFAFCARLTTPARQVQTRAVARDRWFTLLPSRF